MDLAHAFARLAPDDRALLSMRYVAGFDATELGRATGRSPRARGRVWPACSTDSDRSSLMTDLDASRRDSTGWRRGPTLRRARSMQPLWHGARPVGRPGGSRRGPPSTAGPWSLDPPGHSWRYCSSRSWRARPCWSAASCSGPARARASRRTVGCSPRRAPWRWDARDHCHIAARRPRPRHRWLR